MVVNVQEFLFPSSDTAVNKLVVNNKRSKGKAKY